MGRSIASIPSTADQLPRLSLPQAFVCVAVRTALLAPRVLNLSSRLLAVASAGYVCYSIYIWPRYIDPVRNLPGPPSSHWLLGHLEDIAHADRHPDLIAKQGKLFSDQWPSRKLTPSYIRAVWRRNADERAARRKYHPSERFPSSESCLVGQCLFIREAAANAKRTGKAAWPWPGLR